MKKLLGYLRYFFYIGLNWNFRLAVFITRREISGEKKYNVNTSGIDDLTGSVGEDDREHASIYQPVNFYTAEELFNRLTEQDFEGSFLDVGCGKGRVLAMAAAYGFKEIIGIDFSPKLCHEAVLLCDEIESQYPDTALAVECEDARYFEIPTSVTVIFLFNPFDDLIMKDFIAQVEASLSEKRRSIKILYANPQCRKILLDSGFQEIDHFKKMKYLEGSVFVK